ncbi:MAG: carboxypeptidase regulatory-like domain-containing protein [Acidimicrobiia bacterium]|nr:carboxypeptidase regulatory-like domain-containing protein [Acidimicrobiia bacterium]
MARFGGSLTGFRLVRQVAVVGVAAMACLARGASAQSVITGTVTDTTGALLPGVTVEAGSPALIERIRVDVTNREGSYRIVDVRPGPYSVTFTLPGFSTLRRDGIDLVSNFTADVSVQLSVGGVEEGT